MGNRGNKSQINRLHQYNIFCADKNVRLVPIFAHNIRGLLAKIICQCYLLLTKIYGLSVNGGTGWT